MKNKLDTEYIDERIEAKLISKIAHYRLQIRDEFRTRHNQRYPELHYISVKGSIRNLRVWNKMAYLIDEAKYRMPNNPVVPYSIYTAKKLTTL
tara:strand:+ start:493 stop:771 length:279 start_codon:yes stop_codon:yes gene_type:complete